MQQRPPKRVHGCPLSLHGNWLSGLLEVLDLDRPVWWDVFTVCIRTENQNQASFSPFGPHEISVLIVWGLWVASLRISPSPWTCCRAWSGESGWRRSGGRRRGGEVFAKPEAPQELERLEPALQQEHGAHACPVAAGQGELFGGKTRLLGHTPKPHRQLACVQCFCWTNAICSSRGQIYTLILGGTKWPMSLDKSPMSLDSWKQPATAPGPTSAIAWIHPSIVSGWFFTGHGRAKKAISQVGQTRRCAQHLSHRCHVPYNPWFSGENKGVRWG